MDIRRRLDVLTCLRVLNLVFLIYLVAWIITAQLKSIERVGAVAGLGLFVAVYLWASLARDRSPAERRPLGPVMGEGAVYWLAGARLALLVILAVTFSAAFGHSWFGLFIYVSVTAACELPSPSAFFSVSAMTALMAVIGIATNDWSDASGLALINTTVGFGVIGFVRLSATNQALNVAREELARLAVEEERSRIARDLHDLLGHSLSTIALKAELAGRLLPVHPDQTAREIADIRLVTQDALREVRQAVTGFRLPRLSTELNQARDMLAAAGIQCREETEAIPSENLPAATEAVLAWVIREGVTNVVRHSGARSCTIRATRVGDEAHLDVIDDGVGDTRAVTDNARAVNGLAGLTERVRRQGGRLVAGSRPRSGFRLSVVLPIQPANTGQGVRVDMTQDDACHMPDQVKQP